ncbi:hypothetical protein ILUMI_04620 [Ignelater luminosus]|uniref:Uncharacterized protein n=1 Tax=Ignelater luminosus TaxID=2038154 RepID=A0A8K0DE42_IGNLU|nr:hypothetical protein ILUMI_04620 [Ignelater luminosus]
MRYKASNRKNRAKIEVVPGKGVAASENHFSDSTDLDDISLHNSDSLLDLASEADLSSDEEETLSVRSQVVKVRTPISETNTESYLYKIKQANVQQGEEKFLPIKEDMSEQQINEYKIRVLTTEDQSLVVTFLKNFFFPSEPLNEALLRDGIQRQFSPECRSLTYLPEGLSLACVTPSGEIIGIILNSKMENHFHNESGSDDLSDPYRMKISNLLDHIDKQITLSRKLNDLDKEINVKVVTVSDKWRNKGIGKKRIKSKEVN